MFFDWTQRRKIISINDLKGYPDSVTFSEKTYRREVVFFGVFMRKRK